MITVSNQTAQIFVADLDLRDAVILTGSERREDTAYAGGMSVIRMHSHVSVEASAPWACLRSLVLDVEFMRLRAQWVRERGAESSITKIASCPSYQRILAKGLDVVPLILRELEREGEEPDQWFWALAAITEEDPVPEDARGDVVQMAQAWLDWGRQRYAW